SGTNQIHGDAWEYWQNNLLDANKPFVNVAPLDRKNDFGADLGGPVVIPKLYNGRNKTFVFLIFEDARNSNSASGALNTVPTLAYRQGNFAGALTGRVLNGTDPLGNPLLENAIYDPLTSQTINGLVTRTVFPGNIIPQSRLDPVALKIQAMIPAAPLPGNINNWPQSVPYITWAAQPAFKIDQVVSATQKITLYVDRPTNRVPGNLGYQDGLPYPISQVTDQENNTWIARLNYDYNITPVLLMHLG